MAHNLTSENHSIAFVVMCFLVFCHSVCFLKLTNSLRLSKYVNGFFAERLNLKVANDYNYLNQSECLTIDAVDDAQNFHKLMVI